MDFKKYFALNRKQLFKSYSLVILGSIMLAIGTGFFLLPTKLNTGGLSGIAIIVNKIFGLDTDLFVLISYWVLFILSFIFLGKNFTIKSLLSTIIYPLVLIVIARIEPITRLVEQTFLNTDGEVKDTATLLIAGIFGGGLNGVGLALTFLGEGSTGGIDILMFIIHKYTKIKESVLTFLIDATIIFAGIFVLDNFLGVLIGIISALICTVAIEFIFVGKSSSMTAQIISNNKSVEINDYIHNVMLRGSTIIKVEGGYRRDNYEMLVVSFDRKEYAGLINAVARIDKKAFVTIVQTSAVIGEGFQEIAEITKGVGKGGK